MIKYNDDYLQAELLQGDCLDVLTSLPENHVDAIVTDPPYGLKFMSKKWDYDVPTVDLWRACLRVLKPGGHLLAFAGTRTQHRMCINIEDAGFEIRDMIAWVYGSGFPKSLDVSKAVDKAARAEREIVGTKTSRQPTGNSYAQGTWTKNHGVPQQIDITAPATPATPEAQRWDGFGTALKPALEPVTLARKPLSEKTIAANVLRWGTAGLNIDGCRVGDEVLPSQKAGQAQLGTFERTNMFTPERQGRFPANLIHDGSPEVLDVFPETKSGKRRPGVRKGMGFHGAQGDGGPAVEASEGSAARFFYCAKASKADRGPGNTHPTVKPSRLMEHLATLVTAPGQTVLDPFMGSGTTGVACTRTERSFIGIELDPDYYKIACERISW